MSSKFARLALVATAALAVSGASTDAALAGAKWSPKPKPVAAKKCYKRWTTRTGTHKQRVSCKTGRAASWPLPAPYIRG